MIVELKKPKGDEVHAYSISPHSLLSYKRMLYTIKSSLHSPFPQKMSFNSEDEMIKKMKRMADIYGYEIRYTF